MRRAVRALVLLLPMPLFACATSSQLSHEAHAAARAAYVGRVVELRQSSYYGDLYDDNRRWLLTPYRAEHVHHIVDLEGRPIHAPTQRGIVPAGSRFVVTDIEFPTPLVLASRMLTTPRYNPWVVLRPLDTRLKAEQKRPWVVLLPRDLENPRDLHRALSRVLAQDGEVSAWLAKLRPTVRVAIAHKEAQLGMSREELLACLGEPLLWMSEGDDTSVAWYGDTEAWLRKNVVVDLKAARPGVAAAP